jgi:uncharacterized caspase-like protein
LSVGVNQYLNKALQQLKYAVPDAQAISAALSATAMPLFPQVDLTTLYNDQATLTGLETAFTQIAARTRPEDVFVFYIAGHGITVDGHYYFLPHDFRGTQEAAVRQEGISQDHLQRWLASVPARKSLILIDTCQSGSSIDAVAVLRGAPRELIEKTVLMEEYTASAKLMRAIGRAMITAATETQAALEGYRGHGLFTYTILEAMREADQQLGNHDGMTDILELAQYVGDHVSALTYSMFGFEQSPQVLVKGQNFPIGAVLKTQP